MHAPAHLVDPSRRENFAFSGEQEKKRGVWYGGALRLRAGRKEIGKEINAQLDRIRTLLPFGNY